MKNLFIDPYEINAELQSIEQDSTKLALKLSLLSQKIKYIFSQIKICRTFEESRQYFDLLEQIELTLEKLVFLHKVEVPEELWQFTKDFDRIDDYDLRIYMFNEIKNGRLTYE